MNFSSFKVFASQASVKICIRKETLKFLYSDIDQDSF